MPRTTSAASSTQNAGSNSLLDLSTMTLRELNQLLHDTRGGDTLEAALTRCLADLDGFYTFVVGTRDGFAVLRDPVACKPAVMAETDDWVAFGSEFRALSPLPGVDKARLWEPQPATVYAWSRGG